MIISCVKWGDKFTHEHVNRLYKMVSKNFDDEFTFICFTENGDKLNNNIKVIPLDLSYDLENWWWKLLLFKKPSADINLFFDLDVVIQNNITHLKEYAIENKLCMIKAYWKPYELSRSHSLFDTNFNSSILAWKGDLSIIWKSFLKDPEYYMSKYNGIDSFIDYHHNEKLHFFKQGVAYSRLYGIDENNYWRNVNGTIQPKYFFEPNYDVCIFNGWRRKTDIDNGNKYFLDNEGYKGFEHYWD